MIDSTKSPTPAWQRYVMIGLMAVLIVVAGYMIYTKEIKKSSTSSSQSVPAVTATTVKSGTPAHPKVPATTTTTIPGGIPVSPNSPFVNSGSTSG